MSRIRLSIVLLLTLLFFFICQESTRAQMYRNATEEFRIHKNFHSKFLTKDRDIIVWLPPGYNPESKKRYPVLYMHDGSSVFIRWRIDDIARPLVESGQIEPLIIVMMSHGGTQDDRYDEYTPTKMTNFRSGGKADLHGQMLVEELKPFIDSEYNTLTDAAHTGIGGTSLGGLVSLYLSLKYPTVFGKVAVMSPSVWWDDKLIVKQVKALAAKPAMRIWLDIGLGEGASMLNGAQELRDSLLKRGWSQDADLMYFEDRVGKHDEESFKNRAAPMLKYLFPQNPNSKED